VTTLGTGESYTYDANGNMITRVEGGLTYTQTFDAENRLITVVVSGQTTSFVYDGDGNLVKKINPGGSKTLYVAGIYEVDKSSGGTVTGTKTYYPVAGAMRVGSTLSYVLKDHLGSASVVTNTSGTIIGEDRFYPFGETRFTTGTMQTDKLFTGQREMVGLGIYHYGVRFYSPKLGRFLSADTIVPGVYNPQNLNRFSYVRNNPLRYIDPTGHGVDCGIGMGCVSPYVPPYTPPPATNYCTTHPGSCGGGGSGGGGGVSTPPPVTNTPLPVTNTPPVTSTPINMQVTIPTVTPTLPSDLPITFPAPCNPCIGPVPPANMDLPPPTPFGNDVVHDEDFQQAVGEETNPWSPSPSGIDPAQAWNSLLQSLPSLLGLPATTLEQIYVDIANVMPKGFVTGPIFIIDESVLFPLAPKSGES
jgi:RHS repeat-associated protein